MAKIKIGIEDVDVYVIETLKDETSINNAVSTIASTSKVIEVDKPNSNVAYLVVIPASS